MRSVKVLRQECRYVRQCNAEGYYHLVGLRLHGNTYVLATKLPSMRARTTETLLPLFASFRGPLHKSLNCPELVLTLVHSKAFCEVDLRSATGRVATLVRAGRTVRNTC